MQKFLTNYFFKGQEWWVVVIVIEIVFQVFASLYLLVNGLDKLDRNA